jgi:hypothetical protein
MRYCSDAETTDRELATADATPQSGCSGDQTNAFGSISK